MDVLIIDAIYSLRDSFETALRRSVQVVIENYEAYGYALMLGEDLDQSTVIARSNSESDIEKGDFEDTSYYRYTPDEWENWDYDHFNDFNNQLNTIYQEFEKTHQVVDDDCVYTDDATRFMETLHGLYLESMKTITKEFDSISYWVIWISDSHHEIIKKPFLELNTDEVIKEANHLFEC